MQNSCIYLYIHLVEYNNDTYRVFITNSHGKKSTPGTNRPHPLLCLVNISYCIAMNFKLLLYCDIIESINENRYVEWYQPTITILDTTRVWTVFALYYHLETHGQYYHVQTQIVYFQYHAIVFRIFTQYSTHDLMMIRNSWCYKCCLYIYIYICIYIWYGHN